MAVEDGWIIRLLGLLNDGRPRSEAEIIDELGRDLLFVAQWGDPFLAREALQVLEKLGVVRRVVYSTAEVARWQAAWLNNDDGGGRGEPPFLVGGAGGDDGGAGLGELIAHPVFLCLREIDQESLLRAALDVDSQDTTGSTP